MSDKVNEKYIHKMVSLIVFQGKEVDLAHLSYLPEEHFSCPD